MTNEEKALDLAKISENFYDELSRKSALEMAKWKDEQYEEEKKELRGLVYMLPMDEKNQTIIEDLKALLL